MVDTSTSSLGDLYLYWVCWHTIEYEQNTFYPTYIVTEKDTQQVNQTGI